MLNFRMLCEPKDAKKISSFLKNSPDGADRVAESPMPSEFPVAPDPIVLVKAGALKSIFTIRLENGSETYKCCPSLVIPPSLLDVLRIRDSFPVAKSILSMWYELTVI